jgi:hypothetical protein
LPGRAVEVGEEAVAGRVHLTATEAYELTADELVVTLEELAPGTVSQLGGVLARSDDVGEEDGREDAVSVGFCPAAGLPDLVQKALDVLIHLDRGLACGEMSRRDFDEPRPGNAIGDVPPHVDRHDRVVGSVQDECRHADRRQHMTNVDLLVQPGESFDRSGAAAPAEVVDPFMRLSIVVELHARTDGRQCLVA